MTIRDLIDFALAAIIQAVGLAALTLAGIRRRFSDRILLWFGVFAAIYGFREGLEKPLAIIAFVEPPIGREMIRWTVWSAGTYAAVGIAVGVIAHNPYRIPEPGVALLWLLFLAIGVQAIVKSAVRLRFRMRICWSWEARFSLPSSSTSTSHRYGSTRNR